jgi:hypothetical protein
MEHIQIKLFASEWKGAKVEDAIPVFHRWIQTGALPGLWIDVADYSHVPAGPGVLLIGHEANVSLDEGDGRIGILYNRKSLAGGDARANLDAAHAMALAAAKQLESEPEFAGKVRFSSDEVQVILNDRLLYPNTDETMAKVSVDLGEFLSRAVGGTAELIRNLNPRTRFMVTGKRR